MQRLKELEKKIGYTFQKKRIASKGDDAQFLYK